MDQVQEFTFSETASHFASDVSTLTLYQVLLGRDPENSLVIEEGKSQRIQALFRAFVRSAEFMDYVIAPLQSGARLRHELTSPAPNAVQLNWIVSLLVLPESQREAIIRATSWPKFFNALLNVPAREAAQAPIATQLVPPGAASTTSASEPSLLTLALAEITAIELRLERLRTVLRDIADNHPDA